MRVRLARLVVSLPIILMTYITVPTTSFAAEQKRAAVTSMKDFEMSRYLGQWYEIARLPMFFERDCVTHIMSTYTPKSNGKIKVDNECRHADGKTQHAIGEATSINNNAGQLLITFLPNWLNWMSFGKAESKIYIMQTDYRTALVGSPDHKYLWIWSRTPQIDPTIYNNYILEAQRQGFDTRQIIINNQK